MPRYLTHFFVAAVTVATLCTGLNWLADPYWMFGGPQVHRFNSIKSQLCFNTRISEVSRVLKLAPQVLILGTSREDQGIDPGHPAFSGKIVFNAAIPGQPYRETRLILEELVKSNHAPEIVVAGLGFDGANNSLPLPADYSDENFSEFNQWKRLVMIHTFVDSLNMVYVNLLNASDEHLNLPLWRKDGFLYHLGYPLYQDGQRKHFQDNESGYLRVHFASHCKSKAGFDGNGNGSNMGEIRQFLAILYRANIKAYLFIEPTHAREWEAVAESGQWGQFEQWKGELVRMNEDEAAKAKKATIPLWDFSGYNSVTTENVPPAGDLSSKMTNYYESSHFTPAAGNLVIDRMFGYRTPERKVPDDFGVQITSANIEAHLTHIRNEREKYLRTHPDDVAEIAAIAREVANSETCKK